MSNDFTEMTKYGITVLITIIISMTGFWLMMGREYITRAEAEAIAADKTAIVSQRLNDKMESDKEIVRALENNTRAINDFQVQIATLAKTLEFMEKKIDHVPITISNN